jgi:hypothetical protein
MSFFSTFIRLLFSKCLSATVSTIALAMAGKTSRRENGKSPSQLMATFHSWIDYILSSFLQIGRTEALGLPRRLKIFA